MRLGITLVEAGSVVISTIGIYLAFVVVVRLAGPRLLARFSAVDLAAAITLGAVMGRAMLGYTPNLVAGLIAMLTLFALQMLLATVRRSRKARRLFSNAPLLLMADGRILDQRLLAAGILEDELRARLRQAGIHRMDEVSAVILERTGSISIIRQGDEISDELVLDVDGWQLLTRSSPHAES